jgi:hypothetical protein
MGDSEIRHTEIFPTVAEALEQVCVPQGSTLERNNDETGHSLNFLIKPCMLLMNCFGHKLSAYLVGELMVCITGEKTLGVWPTN